MKVAKKDNGVLEIECTAFELALDINSVLMKYAFENGYPGKEKYETEVRQPCLKTIDTINDLLNMVPKEIKRELPNVRMITNEDELLHLWGE